MIRLIYFVFFIATFFTSTQVKADAFSFVVQNQQQVTISDAQSTLIFDPVELNVGEIVEGEKLNATLLIRNNGSETNQIVDVESSCGCTTVEPDLRVLPAGAFTTLHVEIDTFGKLGEVKKTIVLTDQYGHQSTALLHLHVKSNPHVMREGRSIFDGKCGSCHFAPAAGKTTGQAIYAAVCVMCHGKEGQGGYAPKLAGHDNLQVLKGLISLGTGGVEMPGFSRSRGGPLNSMQINALARWIISLDD